VDNQIVKKLQKYLHKATLLIEKCRDYLCSSY